MECLQEIKCFDFSREKICLLWETNEVDWVENKAINSAEGFLRCGVISRFRCLVLLAEGTIL